MRLNISTTSLPNYVLPEVPALKMGIALQIVLGQIAQRPLLGREYTKFDCDHGFAIRSGLSGKYKIFYRTDLPVVEIVAVLHGKRDVDAIMRQCLS